MRVIGCLSWYEESPAWLAALVASASGLVDHFVAVDGAYFLYPGSLKHPTSGPEQAEAIVETARACGIGCTIYRPRGPWMGNETEKRTRVFQLGAFHADDESDWLLLVDGDDLLDHVPFDAKERLEASDKLVAEVSLWWREDWEAYPEKARLARGGNGQIPDEWTVNHRALVRALPSLRCGFAHMVYEADVGGRTVYLRGAIDGYEIPLEPAEDLTDLRVEHKNPWRNPARRAEAASYYRLRNELGVESPPDRAIAS